MKPEVNGLSKDQQLGYLQVDNLKLKQENTRLRKALRENSRHARRIEKAYDDALLLATFYSAGIIPSRRYARLKGLSQNRWENSVALLKMARVVERHRRWVVGELEAIEKKLTMARDKALEDPALFFLRANKHCRQ
jgi:hypothetical protein